MAIILVIIFCNAIYQADRSLGEYLHICFQGKKWKEKNILLWHYTGPLLLCVTKCRPRRWNGSSREKRDWSNIYIWLLCESIIYGTILRWKARSSDLSKCMQSSKSDMWSALEVIWVPDLFVCVACMLAFSHSCLLSPKEIFLRPFFLSFRSRPPCHASRQS